MLLCYGNSLELWHGEGKLMAWAEVQEQALGFAAGARVVEAHPRAEGISCWQAVFSFVRYILLILTADAENISWHLQNVSTLCSCAGGPLLLLWVVRWQWQGENSEPTVLSVVGSRSPAAGSPFSPWFLCWGLLTIVDPWWCGCLCLFNADLGVRWLDQLLI